MQEGNVDVCVVDMVMPELSGPEVIERIERIDRRIVFIAVSGHDAQDLFRRAADHVAGFLRKPIEPEQLIHAIARTRRSALARRM